LKQFFLNGDFTVNTSNDVPFTCVGIDQAMELLNKTSKGQGGICGITSYPTTLLKFCLTAPELACIATEAEQLVTVSNTATTEHHCLMQAKVACQEQAIIQLKGALVPCNLFRSDTAESIDAESSTTTYGMFKLMSKEIIAPNIQESILSTEEVGKEAYTKFVQERLVGTTNLWDKMTKVKLLTWNASAKNIQLEVGSQVLTLKATTSLFARLLVIARSTHQNVDLEKVTGVHEFTYTSRVLMEPD
jgi:hypothetical protein